MSPSTTIKTVALAGASGSLGAPLLSALLTANYTVTVLARAGSTTTYPPPILTALVDYTSPATLLSALQGQDAVISAVGYAAFRGQEALIDAAILAGVQRFIPSEYGADPENKAVRDLPVFADKVRIERYLREKTRGTGMTFTLVCNNEFLDWDLEHAFGVDIARRRIEIFDGGDVVHTATPVSFVARGVVAVLQRLEETRDRVVRLHGTRMTQNRLLEVVQRFTGKEGWEVRQVSTREREEEGWRVLRENPNDWMGWGVPFLQVSIWGERFGGDFSKRNDNEVLGLRELSEGEVEEIVRVRAG